MANLRPERRAREYLEEAFKEAIREHEEMVERWRASRDRLVSERLQQHDGNNVKVDEQINLPAPLRA